MNDDLTLLRDYARNGTEDAFAAVVSRHVNLVYSVALRRVNDPHFAEEITQAVFIILARKAGSLGPNTILAGWLCRTARYVSANALTMQRRRQRREQEAYMQKLMDDSAAQSAADETWMQIAPLLDDALEKLGRKDHDALVLRYFEGRPFAEVGAALGASEDAAKVRVGRALEKLRITFTNSGVRSTTAVIAGVITANSVHAAPMTLAKSAAATAIAKGATAGVSTSTLVNGALKLMAFTKAKTTIITGIGILLLAGTTTVTVKEIQAHKKYVWEVPNADFGVFYKSPPSITIVPTKYAKDGGWCCDGGRGGMGIAQPVEEIVHFAYQKERLRTVMAADMPPGKYDFFAKLVRPNERHKNTPTDEKWSVALQKEVTRKFGITGHMEMRDEDVLVLKPAASGARGFKISHTMPNGRALSNDRPGSIACFDQPTSTLIGVLEQEFKIPIIDKTGLMEQYDYALTWDEPNRAQPNPDGMKQALHDQLGLDLVPSREPIEMLVVQKAK